jgi:membrane associated rhomboid family serine protease
MNALMDELERARARWRRVALLVVVAVLAGMGTWLTAPYGIVLILDGEQAGWILLAAGVLLLAVTVVCIVSAVRNRLRVESRPGKANPRFDEPEASQDPRPGGAWIDSGIGSR